MQLTSLFVTDSAVISEQMPAPNLKTEIVLNWRARKATSNVRDCSRCIVMVLNIFSLYLGACCIFKASETKETLKLYAN